MSQDLKTVLSSVVLSGNARIYATLRDSMWLYIALVLLSDPDGTVHRSFEDLSHLTGIKEATLRSWSGHLRKAGLVGLLDPEDAQGALFAVHGLKSMNQVRQEPPRQDANPTAVALACYLVKGLGEEDSKLDDYIRLCERTPREVVLSAFKRARDVPEGEIRKSRAALFNYLIQKYEQHQNND